MTVRLNTPVTWNPNPTTRGRVAQVTADGIAIQFFNPHTGSAGRETVTPAQFATSWSVVVPDARHLNLVTPYADYSDTYSVNYGRATGRVAQAAEALADVVDAYRKVVDLSRSQPNSRNWRNACREHHAAAVTYRNLTGMTMPDIAAKTRDIAECFASA